MTIDLSPRTGTEPISRAYCMDNMEFMKSVPDKYFSVSIVDPPYGIGFGTFNRTNKDGAGNRVKANKYHHANWDDAIPSDEYFAELMRISQNQIIWGGNYFPLPPCKGFVFWYKKNPVPNFADGEFAWTSFNRPAKRFEYKYYGNIEGNTNASDKCHPTQKPLALYAWLMKEYCKTGDRIFDSHLGSGNSRIAAAKAGLDFFGTEIDPAYYEASCSAFAREIHGTQVVGGVKYKQNKIEL